jgi:23S rRNA (cytosine1962-C5)-methyltransferase
VDRYGDVLVAQFTTAGMEGLRESVVSVLDELLAPKAILLKNDSPSRALEGLEGYVEAAKGTVPDEVEVRESGLVFPAPLKGGQKTGWFYDQRDNRRAFARFAPGQRVLDAFSYVGSFGLSAAAAKATDVLCLDQSETALDYALRGASANNVADVVRVQADNAFDALTTLHADAERFGAVSLDPPAFMKRKKDRTTGLKAYATLNWLGLRLVEDGGVLMTCSCSQHLSAWDLRTTLVKAATRAKVRLQILHQGHQGADHPVHPAMPETDYLKGLLVRVLR